MRLVDGADAIRGDLPSASTVSWTFRSKRRIAGLRRRRVSVDPARSRPARNDTVDIEGPAITIGGDCGVELAAVARVADTRATSRSSGSTPTRI